MKILVTGATGFIGSHIVEALNASGHSTVCLVRNTSSVGHLQATPTRLVPWDNLEELMHEDHCIEYVIHAAAATRARNYQQYYDANVAPTMRLIRAFRDSPNKENLKRFLLVSSQAVAGPSNAGDTPLDETSPPAPMSDYGRSKLEAEKVVWDASDTLPVTVVRPCTVFGPRDVDVLGVFRSVRWGVVPYVGGADRYVSVIFVQDLVQGIVAALFSPSSIGKTYFMANPQPVIWKRFALEIAEVTGCKALPIPVPLSLMRVVATAGDFMSYLTRRPLLLRTDKLQEMIQEAWVCSPSRALQDFGWQASTPLRTAIALTHKWYEAHGWL